MELNQTDTTLDELVERITTHCAPFLKEAGNNMLLRGIDLGYADEIIDDILYHYDFRNDRGPMNAFNEYFYFIDSSMKQAGFKATRSNSDMFTGDVETASHYADDGVYACFIVGNFDYTYNPNVHDYLDDMLLKQGGDKLYKKYLHGEPAEAAEKWWEKIGGGYKTTDLSYAIQNNVEIMITGDNGYYAVPMDVAEDVYNKIG